MSAQDIPTILDRLIPSFDHRDGDWHDVVARSRTPIARVDRRLPARHGERRRAVRGPALLIATVAIATVVALSIASPWRGGPGVLERAAAAIAGPTSTQILYERITVTSSASRRNARMVVHVQLWLAGGPPNKFRVLMNATSKESTDVGGVVGQASGLNYDAAANVFDPVPFQFRIAQRDLDPAAFLRAEITAGRATLEGSATIAGRPVRRILVTSRQFGRVVATARYFVDSRTYEPVRVIVDAVAPNASPLGFPFALLTSLPYGQFSGGKGRRVYTYDFAAFQYIAPTVNNLKLTDVRAQHPRAKVV